MSWRIENAKPLPVLRDLPAGLAQTCITSPPPWVPGEGKGYLAYSPSPEAYVREMVGVMREVARVLRHDGTLWVTLAEPNSTSRPGSDLIGLPWQVALALQGDGWSLRAAIPVVRHDPVPDRGADRPARAHEYLFLLSRHPAGYYYDADAFSEPAARREWPSQRTHTQRLTLSRPATHAAGGRRRSWSLHTDGLRASRGGGFLGALTERCVLAGSAPRACGACGTPWKRDSRGDWRAACAHHNPTGRSLVLDPFCATATTGVSAVTFGRSFLGIEHSSRTVRLARRRLVTTKERAR
jgi:hypothetical protein